MNYHGKLDMLLRQMAQLNNGYFHSLVDIYHFVNPTLNYFDTSVLLSHLERKGYIERKEDLIQDPISDMPTTRAAFRITLQGLLFLENSSFINEIRSQKLNMMWTILKIIANVINALAIISIGIWGVSVANRANDDKIENSGCIELLTV